MTDADKIRSENWPPERIAVLIASREEWRRRAVLAGWRDSGMVEGMKSREEALTTLQTFYDEIMRALNDLPLSCAKIGCLDNALPAIRRSVSRQFAFTQRLILLWSAPSWPWPEDEENGEK